MHKLNLSITIDKQGQDNVNKMFHMTSIRIRNMKNVALELEFMINLFSPILPNLLPLPYYPSSTRISCGNGYTNLTTNKIQRKKRRLY
jgi:hypothetical protein